MTDNRYLKYRENGVIPMLRLILESTENGNVVSQPTVIFYDVFGIIDGIYNAYNQGLVTKEEKKRILYQIINIDIDWTPKYNIEYERLQEIYNYITKDVKVLENEA